MKNDIQYDFNANLDFVINRTLETAVKGEIKAQDKIMKSKDFNETFSYIEDSLNYLYEKQRTLQDIINYSNIYLKNEINNSIEECKLLLNEIEGSRDTVKNDTFVRYTVPFNSGVLSVTDRDEETLPNCYISNGNLISSYNLSESYDITKVFLVQEDKAACVSSSYENIAETRSYRSFYKFDRPQGEILTEKLTLVYDKPVKINRINLNVSNCKVQVINLLLEDDRTISVNDIKKLSNADKYPADELYLMDKFKDVYIKKIEIILIAGNYKRTKLDYNDYKSGEDFWEAIDTETEIDATNKTFYYYLFGIDNLSVELIKAEESSAFVSKPVQIDAINENENLTLETSDYGFIEYYILDGTKEIPILPEGVTKVRGEKIFYKTPTRFIINPEEDVIVYMNGNKTSLTLQEANEKNDKNILYTVDYTPVLESIDNIINKEIKVKAIIRNYNNNDSLIKKISIKKNGGGKLWIDKATI